MLAGPAMEELGTVGSAASSVFPATENLPSRSKTAARKAYIKMTRTQAALAVKESEELSLREKQETRLRAVTVGVLRDMASSRNSPKIINLAIWVDAGGDPDWAMGRALNLTGGQDNLSLRPRHKALVIPGGINLPPKPSAELNEAYVKMTRASDLLAVKEIARIISEHQRAETLRAVTSGLLKDMAAAGTDPQLHILAMWVAAGGDPRIAFGYALAPPEPQRQPASDGFSGTP